MKNGKYAKRRGVASKTFALVVVMMLVIGCTIGGTIAWLTATSGPVTNTFTVGDINIHLYEHEYNAETNTLGNSKVTAVTNYKIVPGTDLPKDPTVEVEADSEACWLFVKVEAENWPQFTEVNNTDKKVSYAIEAGWQELDGVSGVYYREVNATDAKAGISYQVLANNKVTVSENLTKAEVKNITSQPTLTFTAYAVQKDNIADAATAWSKVSA